MRAQIYTKIMVFGTFDYLHPGHLNFFKQARELAGNPWLIVSVARDSNVQKIKKSKPENTEKERLELISNCKLVDEAVLGGKNDYIGHIVKHKPLIIALGHDQIAYTQHLAELLAKKNISVKIVRLKPYKRSIYSTYRFKPLRKEV